MQSFAVPKALAFAILVAFIAACSGSSCSSPEDQAQNVIKQHILTEGFMDDDGYAETLVSADRQAFLDGGQQEYPFETSYLIDAMESTLSHKISVDVTSTEIDDDTMIAHTSLTLPDQEQLEGLIDAAFANVDIPDDADEDQTGQLLGEAARESLEAADLSTVQEEQEYTLKREDGQWLIFLNLAAEEEVRAGTLAAGDLGRDGDFDAAYDKLDELRAEFDSPELHDIIDEALVSIMNQEMRSPEWEGPNRLQREIEYYEKVIDIDPDWSYPAITTDDAKERITEINAEMEAKEATDAYRENLAIDDVSIEESTFGWDITGQVTNAGDRPLGAISISYALLDDDGNELESDSRSIFSANDPSVHVDPLDSGDDIDFSFVVSHELPAEWSQNFDADVGDFEFWQE